MTVRQLIEQLSKLPPELEIVMSKDAEGNSYSPLSDCSLGCYMPYSTWSGEFSSEGNFEADREYFNKPLVVNAVCLWPVN